MRPATEDTFISEMMLARAVLEEGNERLETADEQLLGLHGRERSLRVELAQLRAETIRLAARARSVAQTARERGTLDAVCGVIAAIDAVDETPQAEALLSLLAGRYGVQVIGSASLPLDPTRFRVVERCEGAVDRVEVLRRGYILGRDVLRPALVRVHVGPRGA